MEFDIFLIMLNNQFLLLSYPELLCLIFLSFPELFCFIVIGCKVLIYSLVGMSCSSSLFDIQPEY